MALYLWLMVKRGWFLRDVDAVVVVVVIQNAAVTSPVKDGDDGGE